MAGNGGHPILNQPVQLAQMGQPVHMLQGAPLMQRMALPPGFAGNMIPGGQNMMPGGPNMIPGGPNMIPGGQIMIRTPGGMMPMMQVPGGPMGGPRMANPPFMQQPPPTGAQSGSKMK
jgi:hypothetical protein